MNREVAYRAVRATILRCHRLRTFQKHIAPDTEKYLALDPTHDNVTTRHVYDSIRHCNLCDSPKRRCFAVFTIGTATPQQSKISYSNMYTGDSRRDALRFSPVRWTKEPAGFLPNPRICYLRLSCGASGTFPERTQKRHACHAMCTLGIICTLPPRCVTRSLANVICKKYATPHV